MKSRILYGLVALVFVAVGFVAARYWFQPPAAPAPVAVATPAPPTTLPAFTLQNREGVATPIGSFAGKSLVLNFWATWCAPCRREIPLLIQLNREHAADGIQVVGVAVDFREDVLKYADSMKIDYPLLIGEQDGLAAVDAFGLGTMGFPFTVFTDAKGNILLTHVGELHANQAEVILSAIKKVNRGELAVDAARTEVKMALARLSAQASTDS